jgi:hypothetical protein
VSRHPKHVLRFLLNLHRFLEWPQISSPRPRLPPSRSATRSAQATASPQPATGAVDHLRTNFLNYVPASSSADSSIACSRPTSVTASGSGESVDLTLSHPH